MPGQAPGWASLQLCGARRDFAVLFPANSHERSAQMWEILHSLLTPPLYLSDIIDTNSSVIKYLKSPLTQELAIFLFIFLKILFIYLTERDHK